MVTRRHLLLACLVLTTPPFSSSKSSCVAQMPSTDVVGHTVIPEREERGLPHADLCGGDANACCALCDEDAECNAWVWKQKEPYGFNCTRRVSFFSSALVAQIPFLMHAGIPTRDLSFCWLLKAYNGLKNTTGQYVAIFGQKQAPTPLPTPCLLYTSPSPRD